MNLLAHPRVSSGVDPVFFISTFQPNKKDFQCNISGHKFAQREIPPMDLSRERSMLKRFRFETKTVFCVTEHTQVFQTCFKSISEKPFLKIICQMYIVSLSFHPINAQNSQTLPIQKIPGVQQAFQSHQTATHRLSTCCWCRVQGSTVTAPPEGERCLGGSTSQKRWQMNIHSLFQDPHISQKNQVKLLLVTLTGRGSHPVPIYVYTYIPSLKLTVRT